MTKIKIYIVLVFSCISTLIYGQEAPSLISNEGVLSVSSEGLVSFEGTFENQVSGDVTNDGTVLYYHDFINDGGYSLTKGRTTQLRFSQLKVCRQQRNRSKEMR